jgi:hypothetical protein
MGSDLPKVLLRAQRTHALRRAVSMRVLAMSSPSSRHLA